MGLTGPHAQRNKYFSTVLGRMGLTGPHLVAVGWGLSHHGCVNQTTRLATTDEQVTWIVEMHKHTSYLSGAQLWLLICSQAVQLFKGKRGL